MVNADFAKRFFEWCRIVPDPTLNAKLFKELFGYVAKARYPISKFLTNYC